MVARPLVGINQLHQQLERRAFAGAVRAQEAEDFAGFDAERQRVERANAFAAARSQRGNSLVSASVSIAAVMSVRGYLPPGHRFSSQAMAASKNSPRNPGSCMPFMKNVGVPPIFS
jgi:hypothetical protein